MWNPDTFTRTWNFAAVAHQGQTMPGSDIPYIRHIGNVAMEVMTAIGHRETCDCDLLVQCALLHDVIEDTNIGFEKIKGKFGDQVANGVLALTKNSQAGTKEAQMVDSLQRIKEQSKEIWMVKLADRISNLQPPPAHWTSDKINRYKQEAQLILDHLGSASHFLSQRLKTKIVLYGK